jgi:NAD(P)-dependent dehydrogenase (short-subunit alcohol dehydrogenase family)
MDIRKFQQQYDFSDQTAVVTGGAGVLGGEVVCALAGLGANVVVLDLVPGLPEPLEKRTANLAGKVRLISADVLARESLLQAERDVRAAFGSASILVNAAGGNKAAATTGTDMVFFELPEEALRSVLDLNLMGTILCSQVFARGMADQKRGVILNFSSMNALRPLTRIPAYSAAKAGVSNFTQWLAVHMAQEYSPEIRVNAVAPGFFLTEQNRFLLTEKETGKLTPRGEAILRHLPMGRFGTPEDLLGAVLWLLSPASAYVTGVVVPVDGGFSAYSGV